MALIWWVAMAFFLGGLGGAVLVALLNINAREEDRQGLETQNDLQVLA
ncbi:MAG: hypothetical protein M3Z31_08575 [Pseudomonadota bacterium]|nr:hypothetical protein [Pseudomonadota bacterium]